MAERDRGKKVISGGGDRPSGQDTRSGSQSGNPADESRLTPDSAVSSMSEGELRSIRARFGVPDDYLFHVPGPSGRASNPPDGQITVYEEYMRAGLRFPLIGFIRNLFNYYFLSFGQLAPNSIRTVVGFFLLCHLAGVEPRMGLFRPVFVLRRHSRARGWWVMNTRSGRFLPDLPSSIHGWKTRYFFVSGPDDSWGFPNDWSEPRTSPNDDASVWSADDEDFKLLDGMTMPALKELITDSNLYDAEAGPPPRAMFTDNEVGGMFRKRPSAGGSGLGRGQKRRKKTTGGPSSAADVTVAEAVGPAAPVVMTALPVSRPRQAEGGRLPRATSSASETVGRAPTESDNGGSRQSRQSDDPPLAGDVSRLAESMGEPSGMVDHDAARMLVDRLFRPADMNVPGPRTSEQVIPAAFSSLIRAAHDLVILEKGFATYRALARSWADRIQTAEAETQTAKELQAAAEEHKRKLLEDVARIKKERNTAQADLEKEAENNGNLRRRLRETQSEISVARAERSTMEAAVKAAEADVDAVRAETRAARAEMESVVRAAIRTEIESAMRTEMQSALSESVEKYKASPEFKAEVAKASRFFYVTGFGHCKKEVAETFPGLDIDRILDPVAVDEEEDASEEEEEEEASEQTEEDDRVGQIPAPLPSRAATPVDNPTIVDLTDDEVDVAESVVEAVVDTVVEAIIEPAVEPSREESTVAQVIAEPVEEEPTVEPPTEQSTTEEPIFEPIVMPSIAEEPEQPVEM